MVYTMNMVIRMDRRGRIIIPVSIRRIIKSNLFILKVVNGEIHLKPIKTLSLTSLVDSIEIDVKDFADTHELRRLIEK